MQVVKRNGTREDVMFDKVTARINRLCYKPIDTQRIDPFKVAQKVIEGIKDGITTTEIDSLAAETAASMATFHPDYTLLASRIAITSLHKNTKKTFSIVMRDLHDYVNPKTGKHSPLISDSVYKTIEKNASALDSAIIYDRDFYFDYFGFKTLERSYLLKINGKIAERPQHMWMRVAIGIHGKDIEKAIETYNLMSQGYFTHATPTLFNAGTLNPQLSSCFLVGMQSDSIDGIFNTLKQCAQISKYAGGIGLHVHNIRGNGSYIAGTNGTSNGLIPMLQVFNNTARYVDQCLSKNTEIFTKEGIKDIGFIETGDEILDGSGSFNPVKSIRRYSSIGQKLYSISVKHSLEPINVTEDHDLLVLSNQAKMLNFSVIRNRLEKKLIKPQYKAVKDLLVGDFVCFPKINYEKDFSHISEEDCRLYGILLGDGYISNNSWSVYLNKKVNKDTLNFLINYCKERNIIFKIKYLNNLSIFRANFSSNFKFSREMFYDDKKEKKICKLMLFLPEKKSLQIIKGLLETDGSIGNEIQLEMTSKNVIKNIKFILYRLGVLVSGRIRDRVGNKSSYKNITSKKKTYIIRIPKVEKICNLFELKSGSFFNYFEDENYIYSRIDKISGTRYKGIVYDFDMEYQKEPSFITTLGITHNGGSRRKGSFAIYLEPWHSDIFEFLDLKKPHGKEELRARDLFFALWIPDLFMERVKEDSTWTLMCPNECPGLSDVYGQDFKDLYLKYESQNKGRKIIKARELWDKIIQSQIETGTPYMLYKDSCNEKSNQKNLGTIKSSNLCTEIVEYTSPEEIAVCNLASIALSKFVDEKKKSFNYEELFNVTKIITKNLNRVINLNFYPVKEAENSNLRHRPIGIGVQGLADVFFKLRLPFDSQEAKELNKAIFETIYYGALTASNELARQKGHYDSYKNSPASKGILQFDMWEDRKVEVKDGKLEITERNPIKLSDRWDWEKLKENIKKYGLRNSLLIAPMPTASTAQILGNTECFEPISSNIYVRRVLSGEFIMVNKYLLNDLIKLNLWNEDMKQKLIRENGSVQNISEIPEELKKLYRTVWEIPQKSLIDMSADRGAFICQSQSLNLFKVNPTYNELTSMHFYGWLKGLKTGSYYIRTKSARDAIKFTVTPEKEEEKPQVCNINDPDCEACSA